jgi:hypothetical protein
MIGEKSIIFVPKSNIVKQSLEGRPCEWRNAGCLKRRCIGQVNVGSSGIDNHNPALQVATRIIYIYIYIYIVPKFVAVHVGLQNCSYNQFTTLSLYVFM